MIRNSASRCFFASAKNRIPSLIKKPCYKFSIFNARNSQNNRFNTKFPVVCLLLVGTNTFLFLSWHNGWISKEYLLENFSISKESMDQRYYYTLVTSSFFHENEWHFALNTSALFVFGSMLELLYGAGPLLATYSLASIVAGLSFHWYNDSGEEKYKKRRVGSIAPVLAITTSVATIGMPVFVFMGAIMISSLALCNTSEKKDDYDLDYRGALPGVLVGMGSTVYFLLKIVNHVL